VQAHLPDASRIAALAAAAQAAAGSGRPMAAPGGGLQQG
jgi:hypothetical protein